MKLRNKFTKGKIIRTLTNSNFDVATTLASFGRSLYAVNARFGTPVTPDTTYKIVRFSKR